MLRPRGTGVIQVHQPPVYSFIDTRLSSRAAGSFSDPNLPFDAVGANRGMRGRRRTSWGVIGVDHDRPRTVEQGRNTLGQARGGADPRRRDRVLGREG